jgi:sec-independent protein translocase protein TatA
MSPLFGFFEGAFSMQHMLLLLLIGILFFGKRLPEMGRYLGKGIVEFKKGLKGIEDELGESTSSAPVARQEPAALEPPRPPQRVTMNVPKFEDNPNNVTPPPA